MPFSFAAGWIDGYMTCDFTSFSTVFQLYQDDGKLIMKGCVQWNSIYGREDFTSSGDRTRSARSVDQRFPTELPGLLCRWSTTECSKRVREQSFLFFKFYKCAKIHEMRLLMRSTLHTKLN